MMLGHPLSKNRGKIKH
uniref:Uncharacterized protein n=1 Tax=Arundo donax TaxID=35708 RepID=A0A0A9BY30_ARUDO